MGILNYLQRIGRALMVPVATLPAAAILMGVGYWIDPTGWGADNVVAAFLIKSGAAIIDNMSMLFAIGIAYGMSKDKDGAAALTGFVSFMVVTTLCSTATVGMIQGIPPEAVPAAFGKINNQFIGILVGVISAELYNRYSGVEPADGIVILQRPPSGAYPGVICDDPGGCGADVCLAGHL